MAGYQETVGTPIHVVGIGLGGATELPNSVRSLVEQAAVLVGSDRHLSYFPDHAGERIVLGDLAQAIQALQQRLTAITPEPRNAEIVILTSGDPLFFGFGRLLLEQFPPEQLTFHPHISSVQLAFSRIKLPWQDARIISAHGRSLDELTQALQQGAEKLAVLTDANYNPSAIARLLLALDLPTAYQLWVCENLGGREERVQAWSIEALAQAEQFAPLNVVVLLRSPEPPVAADTLQKLPILGLPDRAFLSFSDRPGLMTKREVRTLVLSELALQPHQTIWDIGAGTGSVSIEIARLVPSAKIFAIEKTAVGTTLIQQNCQRFQVENVISIHGSAPKSLQQLPPPDRIFIGGSGGQLSAVLDVCAACLVRGGVIVLALATLEHQRMVASWLNDQNQLASNLSPSSELWQHRLLQVQLSRSVPVGPLTRFAPLNPVTLITITRAID